MLLVKREVQKADPVFVSAEVYVEETCRRDDPIWSGKVELTLRSGRLFVWYWREPSEGMVFGRLIQKAESVFYVKHPNLEGGSGPVRGDIAVGKDVPTVNDVLRERMRWTPGIGKAALPCPSERLLIGKLVSDLVDASFIKPGDRNPDSPHVRRDPETGRFDPEGGKA